MVISAEVLRTTDNKQFMSEYWAWTNRATDYDWYAYTIAQFTRDVDELGVFIADTKYVTFDLYGRRCAFSGVVSNAKWMDAGGWSEKYPALRVALDDYGTHANISETPRGNLSVSFNFEPGNTYAAGVFEGLDTATWDALIEAQLEAEDWEKHLEVFLEGLCAELLTSLQAEYDYLTSEEKYIEYCEDNEVTFDIGD